MKTSTVAIFFFLILPFCSFCQDTTRMNLNAIDKIRLEKKNKFSINGSTFHTDNLPSYLYSSKEAMKEYHKYERTDNVGKPFAFIALGSLVGALTQIGAKNNAGLYLGLSTLASLTIGTHLHNIAERHLRTAVCIYNNSF